MWMLYGEVGRVHVAEPNPASEGQTLHRSVGDGAAKAGVLQQPPRLEVLPAFQRDSLSHFADGDEDALLGLPPAPTSRSPGCTLMVWDALVPAVSGRILWRSPAFSRSLIYSRLAWEIPASSSPLKEEEDPLVERCRSKIAAPASTSQIMQNCPSASCTPPPLRTNQGRRVTDGSLRVIHLRAGSMKPKSLQISVSKRGPSVESFFGQPSNQLQSHLWSLGLPSVLAKTSQKAFWACKIV